MAVDAPAGLDGGDAEGGGEMALAGAGRAEQVDDLGAVDEVELGERQDAVAVEGGLEREVEALEGLGRGEPGGLQGDADAAVLAHVELLGEQRVDGLEGADLAALEALDDVVEGLQGARHAEADEAGLDAVEEPAHGGAPASARRWPTAA